MSTARRIPSTLVPRANPTLFRVDAGGPARQPGPAAEDSSTSLRKAAILVVSLEQPLASQLLAQLERTAVEAVTLEIARLDRVSPEEQQLVLEDFYELGIRRLSFGFEDLLRMDDDDVANSYHDEDAGLWALALAGASLTVREKVISALRPRSASGLSAALDRLGPFRLDDSETAQAEVAERLRSLSDLGAVRLPEPSNKDQLVV